MKDVAKKGTIVYLNAMYIVCFICEYINFFLFTEAVITVSQKNCGV